MQAWGTLGPIHSSWVRIKMVNVINRFSTWTTQVGPFINTLHADIWIVCACIIINNFVTNLWCQFYHLESVNYALFRSPYLYLLFGLVICSLLGSCSYDTGPTFSLHVELLRRYLRDRTCFWRVSPVTSQIKGSEIDIKSISTPSHLAYGHILITSARGMHHFMWFVMIKMGMLSHLFGRAPQRRRWLHKTMRLLSSRDDCWDTSVNFMLFTWRLTSENRCIN